MLISKPLLVLDGDREAAKPRSKSPYQLKPLKELSSRTSYTPSRSEGIVEILTSISVGTSRKKVFGDIPQPIWNSAGLL
ncbi:MAG: hypothetical protein J7J22_03070 [Candidatus Verstraetearchaeota archaeon]|nr:hypothetical protein [Candidatus Verstraetearchaeota archaeon]